LEPRWGGHRGPNLVNLSQKTPAAVPAAGRRLALGGC
jgi:hypothetical protein